MVIQDVLGDYIQHFVPAMQRLGYQTTLAKGGPEYPHLPEQSMFTHVINGVFGLMHLLSIILREKIPLPHLDEITLRKALALYTIHDVHKIPGFQKIGSSEFAIPLERLRDEYNRLGLKAFADIDEYLMRAVNVSKRSQYQGDILLAEEEGSFLWLLVRIADTIASMVNVHESDTLMNYLKQLAPELGAHYRLYYHEIRDVRGVLTNLIHTVVACRLEQLGLHPLLFFANGTLYLGPKQVGHLERDQFLDDVASEVVKIMAQYGQESEAAVEALRHRKYDFEQYVYAFADVPTLLEIVREETLRSEPDAKVAKKDFDEIAKKRKQSPAGWRDQVEARFRLSLSESETFNKYWSRVRRYLLYVDTLLRDLNPTENQIEWFIRAFDIAPEIAKALREDAELLGKGGVGKYVTIIGYHFLKGRDFSSQPAETLPPEQVLERLHQRVLDEFALVDTLAGRKAVIAGLGFSDDLKTYLDENLRFSFATETNLEDDAFSAYNRLKRQGHSAQICSLCNRYSDHVQELRTGILGDFGRVFSNRVLPRSEAPQGNRLWCAVCHLEFILRKLVGLSLPSGAGHEQASRIYLYVLPTFSFTPNHVYLFESLLAEFRRISSLPIRDYGENAPGVPRFWVEHRTLDPEWLQQIKQVLARQSQWIDQHGGRAYRGERLLTARPALQPNYYLIVWDESGNKLTHTEAWAKATFAALVIATLTSARVFVSEHPFLSATLASELKPTITLSAAPPVIRSVLMSEGEADIEISLYGREKGSQSNLERALDILASLWLVTAEVHAPNRPSKDKQIAERLALTATEPLAGAHFYKEYGRLNDGQSPYPPLRRACEILLDHLGGEMMDLVNQLTQLSLRIRVPKWQTGRGKAHSYELVLRETFDAMRKASVSIPEIRKTALTGTPPSADAIGELKKQTAGTVLKAMERRYQGGDGYFPEPRNLSALVGEFVDVVVDELFIKRARGNFSRFLQMENSLADGLYYATDRYLAEEWAKRQNEKKKEETE